MRFAHQPLLLASLLAVLGACNKGGKGSGSKEDPAPDDGQKTDCQAASGEVVAGEECGQQTVVDTSTDTDVELNLEGGTLEIAVVQAGALALETTNLTGHVGQADATQLQSMKYRFQSIEICESMEITGSGFQNPKNCLEIYRGPEVDDDPNTADDYGDLPPNGVTGETDEKFTDYRDKVAARAAWAKANDQGYVDLMNPDSLKKLSSQLKLSEKDAHEYRFGLVNWFRPIKVKAVVPLINDPGNRVIYTKANSVSTVVLTGGDNYVNHVAKAQVDMTVGPAEEAVFEHPNGGAWFAFAKPFVITKADIEQKKNFKLDLTFNPDGIVKAYDNGTGGIIRDETRQVSISVPMLHMTPIAHAADQKVLKETYFVERDEAGEEPLKARIELYTLKGDASKAVYGVDTQSLFGEHSTEQLPDFPQAYFLTQDGDQVELFDYRNGKDEDGTEIPPFLSFTRMQQGDAKSTAKIVSECRDGHPGFMLPVYRSLNCADPNMLKEDDIDLTLDGIYELP